MKIIIGTFEWGNKEIIVERGVTLHEILVALELMNYSPEKHWRLPAPKEIRDIAIACPEKILNNCYRESIHFGTSPISTRRYFLTNDYDPGNYSIPSHLTLFELERKIFKNDRHLCGPPRHTIMLFW